MRLQASMLSWSFCLKKQTWLSELIQLLLYRVHKPREAPSLSSALPMPSTYLIRSCFTCIPCCLLSHTLPVSRTLPAVYRVPCIQHHAC